jgi:hypothetical protein
MKIGKLVLLAMIAFLYASFPSASAQRKPSQSRNARFTAYRGNNCVTCHQNLHEPLRVSAHFYEWLNSPHEKNGVSCEKCHGGDPAAPEMNAAHKGVLKEDFPLSTLHPKNLPTTCGACHLEVVKAFTQSIHFMRLQESNNGPTCTTCHQHMATAVITWPPETSALCANCHNQSGGAAGKYLEIPQRAGETIAAFSRADEVVDWAYFLISEREKRPQRFKPEVEKLKILEGMMASAKLNWHTFDMAKSRAQADQVFTEASKIKDNLWKKQ